MEIFSYIWIGIIAILALLTVICYVLGFVKGIKKIKVDKDEKKRAEQEAIRATEEKKKQEELQLQNAISLYSKENVKSLNVEQLEILIEHFFENARESYYEVYYEYCSRFTDKMMKLIDESTVNLITMRLYAEYLLGGTREKDSEFHIAAYPDLDVVMQRAVKLTLQEKEKNTRPEDCFGLFLMDLVWELKQIGSVHRRDVKPVMWNNKDRLQKFYTSKSSAERYLGLIGQDSSREKFLKYNENRDDYVISHVQIVSTLGNPNSYYGSKANRKMRMTMLPNEEEALVEAFYEQKKEGDEAVRKKISKIREGYRTAVRLYSQGDVVEARRLATIASNAGYDFASLFLLRDEVMQGKLFGTYKLPEYLRGNEEQKELFQRASKGDAKALFMLGEKCLEQAGKQNILLENAAMEWFSGAARLGMVEALISMSEMYKKGKAGLVVNNKRAAEFYKRAAEILQTPQA